MSSDTRLGTEDYRRAALLRIREAQCLHAHALETQEGWTGCIYLAGRAVESVLRSLLWSHETNIRVGHDLRQLWKDVQSKGGITTLIAKFEITDAINEVSIVWFNNLRFVDDSKLKRLLNQSGRLISIGGMRVKGDPLKANAGYFLENCERIVTTLEPKCKVKTN